MRESLGLKVNVWVIVSLRDACEEQRVLWLFASQGVFFGVSIVRGYIYRQLVGDSERAFSGYIGVDSPYRLYVPWRHALLVNLYMLERPC